MITFDKMLIQTIPETMQYNKMISSIYFYIGFVITSFNINKSQLICTVIGSLVNSFHWTKDGRLISDNDPLFSQGLVVINRYTVTSEVVLSCVNISHSVGTY